MNRTDLIQKAAALPVGDPERRALLAGLARVGKVELGRRGDGNLSVNVRVALSVGMVGHVEKEAGKVLSAVEAAFKNAKLGVEKAGGLVALPDMPHLSQLGLSVGRAGLIVDHYWSFKYDRPPEADKVEFMGLVEGVLLLSFKAAGIKV